MQGGRCLRPSAFKAPQLTPLRSVYLVGASRKRLRRQAHPRNVAQPHLSAMSEQCLVCKDKDSPVKDAVLARRRHGLCFASLPLIEGPPAPAEFGFRRAVTGRNACCGLFLKRSAFLELPGPEFGLLLFLVLLPELFLLGPPPVAFRLLRTFSGCVLGAGERHAVPDHDPLGSEGVIAGPLLTEDPAMVALVLVLRISF